MRKNKLITCKNCGKQIYVAPKSRQLFCDQKCYGQYLQLNPRMPKKHSCGRPTLTTLCWTCAHTNQNECSWFAKNAVPVPGWTAQLRPLNGEPSYMVLKCPNYELWKRNTQVTIERR